LQPNIAKAHEEIDIMSPKTYDPMKDSEDLIKSAIESVLIDLGSNTIVAFEPPPPGLGDFAYPCFQLAPDLKKSPTDIANELSSRLPDLPGISYESKGPYLNFKIDDAKITASVLNTIFALGNDYGMNPKKTQKIILEHTSANPTDKLHIGRARNPIIGDTLARLLRLAGYDVETQYYVDDMGKQTARKILEARHEGEWDNENFKTGYQWATSATTMDSEYYDPGLATELDSIMDGLERGDPETLKEAGQVCKAMMDETIIPSLGRIKVEIDRYVNESMFMLDNSVNEVIENLKESEYCGIEDGAKYIDLEPFNIKSGKTKFFFLRADGKSLYATRDIAYHQWKFKNCDLAINILGEDHKLEAEYVRVGLDLMKIDEKPESIFYAFVNLPEGRMSTREGKVVYLDDLVTEAIALARAEVHKRRDDLAEDTVEEISELVGIGAIRFNIIRVQAEKKIVFKWDEALNFEGDSAPFVQYAHARACSILRKSKNESDDYTAQSIRPELITDPNEVFLIRSLGKFPGLVRDCAEKRQGHPVAGYAHEVAAAFNQFYRDCPVLQAENEELVDSRLAVVAATKTVLRNALELLGIEAPRSM
jgi:arginyl-tRNA synthetase